ncbi:MAG: hypothetical protein WAV05_08220 [Anaerolineales bacterium]
MLCPYKTSGARFYEPTAGRFEQVGKKKEGRSVPVRKPDRTGCCAATKEAGWRLLEKIGRFRWKLKTLAL